MLENHRKRLIQHYNLSGQKLIKNAKNSPYWLTVKQCADKSKLLGQKCRNSNETFLSNFQTGRKVGASRFQLQLTRKAGKSGKKEEANGN